MSANIRVLLNGRSRWRHPPRHTRVPNRSVGPTHAMSCVGMAPRIFAPCSPPDTFVAPKFRSISRRTPAQLQRISGGNPGAGAEDTWRAPLVKAVANGDRECFALLGIIRAARMGITDERGLPECRGT